MRLVSGHLKRMESVVQPSQYELGTKAMVNFESNDKQELDLEWVTLIMRARSLGFNRDDVRKALYILKETSNEEVPESAV